MTTKKQLIGDCADWQEVDQALRRMGEIDISLSKLEGEMTLRVNEIKADYDIKAEGLIAERNNLEGNITLYAESHKDEFTKVRSKDLTFGVVAYRVVHKVVIKSKKATVAALEALGLDGYLRISKEPDKETMKLLDAGTLAKVGARVKTDDKISVEPNIESIRGKE
ncbi:MAG: host-nuclease inhibitor Gam family protein [Syntrophobacterales bacterium]|jgi:phage host-nuclease inhibitor protein Gam|nr:host-nuclease inhibitor Gam family protein [Syntrophobacterales bacterium]